MVTFIGGGQREEGKDGRTDKHAGKGREEEGRNPHGKHTHSWIMGLPSPLADSNEISISTTLIKRWETSAAAAVDDGIPENSPHARTHVSSVTAGFIKRHVGYRDGL